MRAFNTPGELVRPITGAMENASDVENEIQFGIYKDPAIEHKNDA